MGKLQTRALKGKDDKLVETTPSLVPTDDKPYPQVVYVSEPITEGTLEKPGSSKEADAEKKETMEKYEESKEKYPFLNLREGEYVVETVESYPQEQVRIFTFVVALIPVAILLIAVSFIIPSVIAGLSLAAIVLLMVLGAAVALVFEKNHLYVTNENVTLVMQEHMFKKRGQTLPLLNLETITFKKEGILQSLLNIGSLNFIAEGGTVKGKYRFHFVKNPEEWVHKLSTVMEDYREKKGIVHDDL